MWTVSHLSGVEHPFSFPGSRYNIIQVPPQKSNCSDTLEGAKVLCSIAPMDKMKPSYYHSFGKNAFYLKLCGFSLLRGRKGCSLPSAPEIFYRLICLILGWYLLPSLLRNEWKLHHFHWATHQAESVADYHFQTPWESHFWRDKMGASVQYLLPCGE